MKAVKHKGLVGNFKNGKLYTSEEPDGRSYRVYKRGVRLDDRNRETLQSQGQYETGDIEPMNIPDNQSRESGNRDKSKQMRK